MKKPLVREHNTSTGEVIDREMNDDEFAQYQIDVASDQAKKQAEIDAQANRQILLDRLGITEEEAKLLLHL